ncbi:igLON family member 5-like [Ptychodera flava]|uniref:igLON family member 5-like n=1 Tax=Ptychodera flava TaxID=63121 RepID=UPI003969E878
MGPFLEGDEVFAVCEITEDGNPKTLNAWYWLEPDGRNNSDGEVLNLGSVTRRDNGTYTCVAENMYYDNSIGRGIALYDVLVHYPPGVSIEDNSNGRVIVGDTFTADCVADSNPEADYKWTFPDGRLSTSSQLEIPSALKSDSGNYTYKPVITSINYGPISPTGQVIVNSSIAVLCDVMESNPAVEVVSWEHRGDWLNFNICNT